MPWIPEDQLDPLARKRFAVRIYRHMQPRLRAVADAYGLTIGEYVERCILRDERALADQPTPAAVGRKLVKMAALPPRPRGRAPV